MARALLPFTYKRRRTALIGQTHNDKDEEQITALGGGIQQPQKKATKTNNNNNSDFNRTKLHHHMQKVHLASVNGRNRLS